jgi:hypothetical protein
MSYFRELLNFKGMPSAGRFGFLYSVLLSNSVVWYTWLFVCIWTRSIVDIPVGVYTTYGIANGVAFAGKGVQSLAERPVTGTQTTFETSTKSTMGESNENRPDGNRQ